MAADFFKGDILMKHKRMVGIGIAVMMAMSNADFSFAAEIADNIAQSIEDNIQLKAYAEGEYPVDGGSICYEEYNNYCRISGVKGNVTDLKIPEYINGKPVQATISGSGNDSYNTIKSITVPAHTYKKVHIDSCNSVESIIFEDGRTSLESGSINLCENLKSVYIPDSVTYIENFAIQQCKNLSDVRMSRNIKEIKNDYFYLCGIENIDLSETQIENIDKFNISTLKNIKLPKNLKTIGDGAFNYTKIEEIDIPSSVTDIGKMAFENCHNLKKINFNNAKITEIKEDTFSYCDSLESIELPDSITDIKNSVFKYCHNLSYVKLPRNLKVLGENINNSTSGTIGVFHYCTSLKNIDLPEGLKIIGDYTFDISGLTTITLPDSLEIIGNGAFGCENLEVENVELPSSLKYVGPFGLFRSIGDTFEIPESFTDITEYAFSGFKYKKIIIPDTVTSIDMSAFESFWEEKTENGYIINETELYIPSSVTYIKEYDGYYGRLFYGKLFVERGSYAEQLAIERGVEYEYYGDSAAGPADPSDPDDDFDPSQPKKKGAIKEVILNDGYGKKDILGQTVKFTEDRVEAVNIKVNVEWGDEKPGNIYLSSASGEKISASGEYIGIIPGKIFKPNENVFVTVFNADGKLVESRKVYIKVQPKPVENNESKKDVSLKLFNTFTYKFDDKTPVLAGSNFSVSVKNFGLSLNKNLEKKTYEASVSKSGDSGNLYLISGMSPVKFGGSGSISGPLSDSGNIAGVTSGKVSAFASLNFDWNGQGAIGAVPVYYKVGVSGSAKADLILTGKDLENLEKQGVLTITPEGHISGGVGVVKAIEVGAKGSVSLPIEMNFKTKRRITKINGSAGIYASVLGKTLGELSYPLMDKEIENVNFYSLDDSEPKVLQASSAYMYTPIKPENRSYIKKASEWTGGKDDGLSAYSASNKKLKAVQANIYPNARPYMTESGGKRIMLWIADNTERDDYNKAMLVYSVYDNESGLWGAPQAVYDNGAEDYLPVVKDGYVVWQKASRTFGESDTLADVAAASEIYVSHFNGTSFDTPVRITDNAVSDAMPSIAVDGSKASVVWVSNDENDVLGITGKNSLYKSELINGSWSAPECIAEDLNSISSVDAGYMNGEFVTAFSHDEDGNIGTVDDKELYIIRNGNVQRFTDNDVMDSAPHFEKLNGETALFWYSGDNISYVADLDDPVLNGVPLNEGSGLGDDFSIISKGGRTAILWTNIKKDASEVCAAIYDSKQWSQAVEITNTNQYAKFPAGIVDDSGNLIIAFNREKTTGDYSTTGQSDLCIINVAPSCDMEVSDLYIEGEAAPDSELPVFFDLTNKGELPVEKVDVRIEAPDGSVIYTDTVTEHIAPGETAEIEAVYTIGSEVVPGEASVYISLPDNTDINSGNDFASADIGLASVKISDAGIVKTNGGYKVTLTAENSGYTDASNIAVYLSKDGENTDIIGVESIETLAAQQKTTVGFFVEDSAVTAAEGEEPMLFVTAEGKNAADNNLYIVALSNAEEAGYILGDADGSGDLSAGDSAAVLQKVLKNSYNLPIQGKTGEWMVIVDVDGSGDLTANDSAEILQKVLKGSYKFSAERK